MERMLIALSALIGLASPASSQNWSRWEIETRLIMKIADAQSETTHAGTTWTTTMAAAAVPGSWCEAATPWLPCVVMVASPCVPVWMRRWCFWSVCAPHRREQALRQARAAPRLRLGKSRLAVQTKPQVWRAET